MLHLVCLQSRLALLQVAIVYGYCEYSLWSVSSGEWAASGVHMCVEEYVHSTCMGQGQSHLW